MDNNTVAAAFVDNPMHFFYFLSVDLEGRVVYNNMCNNKGIIGCISATYGDVVTFICAEWFKFCHQCWELFHHSFVKIQISKVYPGTRVQCY